MGYNTVEDLNHFWLPDSYNELSVPDRKLLVKSGLQRALETGDRTLAKQMAAIKKYDWSINATELQRHPPLSDDWFLWYIMGGRGSGKTAAGVWTLASWAQMFPGTEWGVVSPKWAEARRAFEDPKSGFLALINPDAVKSYNKSQLVLVLTNGSIIRGFTAEKIKSTEGYSLHGALYDELGNWPYIDETLESTDFTIREEVDGWTPRVIAALTPTTAPIIKELRDRDTTVHSQWSTFDNPFLSQTRVQQLAKRYKGTRHGDQMLYGNYVGSVKGALWSPELLARFRINSPIVAGDLPDDMVVAIAVDPSASKNRDACGIIIVGYSPSQERCFILGDETVQDTPTVWTEKIVRCWDREWFGVAPSVVVVETNFAAVFSEEMIHLKYKYIHNTTRSPIGIKSVTAKRGMNKNKRAQPVASLFDNGQACVVANLPALEGELTSWTPTSKVSPNRLDAMVWGVTHFMIDKPVRSKRKGYVL